MSKGSVREKGYCAPLSWRPPLGKRFPTEDCMILSLVKMTPIRVILRVFRLSHSETQKWAIWRFKMSPFETRKWVGMNRNGSECIGMNRNKSERIGTQTRCSKTANTYYKNHIGEMGDFRVFLTHWKRASLAMMALFLLYVTCIF